MKWRNKLIYLGLWERIFSLINYVQFKSNPDNPRYKEATIKITECTVEIFLKALGKLSVASKILIQNVNQILWFKFLRT